MRGMRPRNICLLMLALSIAWPGTPLLAQGNPPSPSASARQAEIADGARVFQNTCSNCHGPDGNEIPGIDLGRGRFRRPMTDQDLMQIIRTGIPGTAMPATNLSEEQAAHVVAYLRSTAATAPTSSAAGDAARGKAVFAGKGACASCHRVNGVGSRLGPDLSDIGQQRRSVDLERSLVDPDAEVLGTNRFYHVTTKDGVTTTGRLLNLDTFTIQMIDAKERLRSFIKADLREHGFAEKSGMPSYKGTLSAQELADVVSYLASLKGRVTP
jgi:putative heme-binding domain-containing protein